MKITRSWVGEAILIILTITVMALIALHAIDKISNRIDQQIKARAAYSEVQR
jgi:hypothetical protein